jgi:hypothetical protein
MKFFLAEINKLAIFYPSLFEKEHLSHNNLFQDVNNLKRSTH